MQAEPPNPVGRWECGLPPPLSPAKPSLSASSSRPPAWHVHSVRQRCSPQSGAAWPLLTLAGALCFTELAVRYPQDGGEYLYLRRGFGRRVAFLYGWMAAVVMYPGVAAALCVGPVPYVQALVPSPAGLLPGCPLSFCSRSARSITPGPAFRAES